MIEFFKNPYFISNKFQFNKKIFIDTVLVFFICTILSILSMGFMFLFDKYIIVKLLGLNSILAEFVGHKDSFVNNAKKSFFLSVLFYPLKEELAFRMPSNFNKNYVALSIGFLFMTFVPIKGVLHIENIYLNNFIKALISLLLAFGVSKFLSQTKLDLYRMKYFKVYFYVLLLLFGLVHLLPLKDIQWNYFYFYPIFLLHHFIFGFCAAYLRNKYHFAYGLILHILSNSIPFIF